jgi:undecaprenyl-diphosphatase
VDVGRFSSGGKEGCFLNTCSLGVYPELVRERDRWSKRIGGWPAGVVAALRVLRADEHPLRAEFQGTERQLWLLFAGNGMYHRMGLTPGRRFDLADGRLDVRVVHGGRVPAARLLAAAVAGPLTRPRGRPGRPAAPGERRTRHPAGVRRRSHRGGGRGDARKAA